MTADQQADGTAAGECPRISLVTPSYNQAPFLEDCIKSVLDQGYPDLEYIVIDGGSTDGSGDIIERYAPRLAYWVSEPDAGPYDAINKGFALATGEVMGWLNSDDRLCPWALKTIGSVMADLPQCRWVTTLNKLIYTEGDFVLLRPVRGYSRRSFLEGRHTHTRANAFGAVQQESTFWRRNLWEQAGGKLDPDYPLGGDFDLWCRFYEHAELMGLTAPLGGPRVHADQRHVVQWQQYCREEQDALEALRRRLKWRPGRVERAAARLGLSEREAVRRWLDDRYAYTGIRIDRRVAGPARWYAEPYDYA